MAPVSAAWAETCAEDRCGCPDGAKIGSPAVTSQPPARADLTVTYYGVSTLMFSDGRDRLLVDGFFTRPKARQLLFSRIDAAPDRIDQGLVAVQPPVRAVLTAHAHHDHALDSAVIMTKAPTAILVGTPSVAKLARDRKTPADRVCVPRPGEELVFGPYTVSTYYVPHGPNPFYLRWLLDHPLRKTLAGPARFWSYKDDQNLSFLITHGGREILVHPSSGRPEAPFDAQIVFLGLGRVGKMRKDDARAYWRSTVGRRTTTVIPIHWDQFTTDLGEPLVKSPWFLDNVDRARRRVCRYARERQPVTLQRMDAMSVLRLDPDGSPRPSRDVGDFCLATQPLSWGALIRGFRGAAETLPTSAGESAAACLGLRRRVMICAAGPWAHDLDGRSRARARSPSAGGPRTRLVRR